MALVVEVSYSTFRADSGEKLSRYAEVGIPVYWLVHAPDRAILVHGDPQGTGADATYTTQRRYEIGEEFPIIVDGREVGRISVADLFPPEPHS